MDLVAKLVEGDIRALARAISLVENGTANAAAVLRAAFPHSGRATVLGFTGPPGGGKSSLVDRLIAWHRDRGRRVGIIAVDPSSAYSGGAILGDRVRMQRHAEDDGVYIRSMATRGHLGGLCRAANDAIDLLDAAGFDPVIVETVGVGQDEIDIARAADVVSVVLVPGMGDDIQAIKAGILEIADLFLINKSDRPGADRLVADLRYMLALGVESGADDADSLPEIVKTVAVRSEGLDETMAAIGRFRDSQGKGKLRERRRQRAAGRFRSLLSQRLLERALQGTLSEGALERIIDDIAERRTDPYSAVAGILDSMEARS